jgi:hypothetical protein
MLSPSIATAATPLGKFIAPPPDPCAWKIAQPPQAGVVSQLNSVARNERRFIA